MLDKEMLKAMAEAERLMDEGRIPWVRAPMSDGRYDRLAVASDIMEELGLEQGQTINRILMDAIAELSIKTLVNKLEELRQKTEDEELDENFDFRNMLDGDNDATKH